MEQTQIQNDYNSLSGIKTQFLCHLAIRDKTTNYLLYSLTKLYKKPPF